VLGRGREKVLVIILGMDGMIENRDSVDVGISSTPSVRRMSLEELG
jgi:hypothetical protein